MSIQAKEFSAGTTHFKAQTDLSAEAQRLLAKLVAFDTTSRKSNLECIYFIDDHLRRFGVESEIIPTRKKNKACLLASTGRPNEAGVMLAGHVDTVKADRKKWVTDPYTLTERDGNLYGRGTADMKGSIACYLALLSEFARSNRQVCVHLALTCDEETDMSGAIYLARVLKERQQNIKYIVLGEPTDLSLVYQHKAIAAFRTRFTGIECHSSNPENGVNAIDLQTVYSNILTDVAQDKKQKPFVDSPFKPPYTTLNKGKVRGGGELNKLAREAETEWEVRAHPGETADEVAADVARKARGIIGPDLPGVGLQVKTLYNYPAFLAPKDNEATRALKDYLKDPELRAESYSTEAWVYRQELKKDIGIIGLGSKDEAAHKPNEFIRKPQVKSYIDLLWGVLLSSPPAPA